MKTFSQKERKEKRFANVLMNVIHIFMYKSKGESKFTVLTALSQDVGQPSPCLTLLLALVYLCFAHSRYIQAPKAERCTFSFSLLFSFFSFFR